MTYPHGLLSRHFIELGTVRERPYLAFPSFVIPKDHLEIIRESPIEFEDLLKNVFMAVYDRLRECNLG